MTESSVSNNRKVTTVFQKFILNLLVAAAKNPDIRAFVFELIEKLAAKLLPDIISTFPTFVAAAMKTFSIKVPNLAEIPDAVGGIAKDVAKQILDSDPDLPGISDVIDLSELARKWLNL